MTYSGGSGLMLYNESESPSEAFNRFITNESCIIANRIMFGTSCAVIQYSGPGSVYRSTDVDTYLQDVTTILVKLVFIDDSSRDFIPPGAKTEFDIGSKILNTISNQEFSREIEIQRDVHDRTNDGNEPLCPTILFSETYENDHILENLTLLKLEKKLIDIIMSNKDIVFQKIGIIVMEFAKDYISMYSLLEQCRPSAVAVNNITFVMPIYMAAAFLLIELAHKTGYTQGDFHSSNIFFKVLGRDSYPYFSIKKGTFSDPQASNITNIKFLKPLFIDFGRAKRLEMSGSFKASDETDVIYDINELYANKEFRKMLGFICVQGCNELVNYIMNYPDFYGWATGINVKPNNIKSYVYKLKNLYNPPRLSDQLTFFVNARKNTGVRGAFDVADLLTSDQLTFLNTNFDGENGIMDTIINARNESNTAIVARIASMNGLASKAGLRGGAKRKRSNRKSRKNLKSGRKSRKYWNIRAISKRKRRK